MQGGHSGPPAPPRLFVTGSASPDLRLNLVRNSLYSGPHRQQPGVSRPHVFPPKSSLFGAIFARVSSDFAVPIPRDLHPNTGGDTGTAPSDPLFQRTCPLPFALNSTFIPHYLSEFSKFPFFPLLMDISAGATTPGSNHQSVCCPPPPSNSSIFWHRSTSHGSTSKINLGKW